MYKSKRADLALAIVLSIKEVALQHPEVVEEIEDPINKLAIKLLSGVDDPTGDSYIEMFNNAKFLNE